MQAKSSEQFVLGLGLALACLVGCSSPETGERHDELALGATPGSPATAEFSEPHDDKTEPSQLEEETVDYPRVVRVGERDVIVHPPQIDSWDDFEVIEGIAAIETVPASDDEAARFGVVSFTAKTVADREARTVRIEGIEVTAIREGDQELPEETAKLFESAVQRSRVVPLDLVLSHLADDTVPGTADGIKSDPPRIFVSKRSAILVLLYGDPVLAPIKGTDVKFAANTNWPLFQYAESAWYLRNDDTWLVASTIAGPWAWAGKLPLAIRNLPEDGNWSSTRAAAQAWRTPPKFDPPVVRVSKVPAELILVIGEPELVPIGDTGVSYAANTESQLFRHEKTWYYLVSGRWFTTSELTAAGPWRTVTELPPAFASIPPDHERSHVLASVPNTAEAKMAVVEAQVPKKTKVTRGTSLPEAVTYTGEPEFAAIPDTEMRRAVNTSFDVIECRGRYYLCYSGLWYVSDDPEGPWELADSIPAEIYSIPASSPAHHVTYVRVYDTTDTYVVYGYTSGYSHVYVCSGVVVWGTGWYYPPYYYYWGGYPVYYRYPYTYGSGSFYNPRTGRYGSVCRAYGPYGGWGYASAYNPRTGTYARAEAVWDYNDWYAVGEAYNPRTGRYYETERHYDADSGKWKIDSTLETRRGDIDVSRRFDDNSGKMEIETSRGGEGTFSRKASNGGWDTSGQYTTADGRTFSSTGRYEKGVFERTGTGTTRKGTTVDTQSTRQGGRKTTRFETSEGARGATTRRGGDRTSVVESGSGDVYAARDGKVYKKTDDGWQRRSNGGWSKVERTPSTSRRVERKPSTPTRDTRRSTGYSSRSGQNRSLDRDYRARSRGMDRSRSFGSRSSGGVRRGGGGRRR